MSRSPLVRLALAVLAAVLTATVFAAPAYAATGKVVGRLTDSAGAPVAGVTVTVRLLDWDWEEDTGEPVRRAVTGPDGRFAVTKVPPTEVTVQFERNGFRQLAGSKDGSVFTLASGGTITVHHSLPPLGTLRGRLVDAAGAPVPGVEVSAADENETMPSYTYLDKDGRYTLDVLAGSLKVGFRFPTGSQWVRGVRDRSKATVVDVAAGEVVTVDETLLPVGGIAGKLVDGKAKPVAGAEVDLIAEGGAYADTVKTDKSGAYVFDRVFPGTYQVHFSPLKGNGQWAFGKPSQKTATPIKVVGGAVTTVNDKLLVPGTIAGRFTDRAGAGLKNVRVEATLDGEKIPWHVAQTDSKGRYKLTSVLPGTYKVGFVSRARRSSARTTQYAYGATSAKAKKFTVEAGKTTTVNDKLVPDAPLKITARDAATGKRISDFCARMPQVGTAWTCTKKSEIVVKNLAAQRWTVQLRPASAGSLYLPGSTTATTVAGRTTTAEVKLAAR